MSTKNSIQEKKELEKFIKFLALKCTQVIVQSRLGEKIQTYSSQHTSGNDWFNIAIQDNPDVLAETKKVLNVTVGESVTSRLPLCVEISLQTVEGDKMILEVWSLGVIPEQSDATQRPTYAVYNQMGLLLKSLISVTRVTPAYKLSRRQSSDSYNIYYKIYVGEPQFHNLGDDYKHVRVGQLCTTVGAINMSVDYRTKMTISPTQTGRNNAIMLKSDHFLKDTSPKHIRYHHNKKSEKKVIDLDKPMRIGAFVDASKVQQYTEEDYILPENPPFSWLLKKPKNETLHELEDEDDEVIETVGVPVTETVTKNNNNSNIKNLEQNEHKPESTETIDVSPKVINKSSRWSTVPAEDEKFLKELHFPFATNNTPISDLAKFYRDCFNAPPLNEFNEPQTNDETSVENLSKQLEQFETSLGEYDSLVTSCCQSVDNNSNS